jgi:GT2 family glycosyltransferase|tara:strand:- start:109 stop:948 length:840 start_codon:yes stop_codon:yes gene_type:complete
MITHCISTHNNLPYLKLAVQSVRTHSYWKDAPFIIHAENCTDGTNEWLRAMADQYDLTYYVDENDNPKGIGGGMNFCADKVKTEYINFLHSDFYVGKDWDLELMKVHDKYEDEDLWVNSFRIEPNMFNSPDRVGTLLVHPDEYGGYHDNFNSKRFLDYAKQFAKQNGQEIPKGEGVSGLVKKSVWDRIGGNDPLFAPTSWDDMDLFLRMLQDGIKFIMPTKSVVYHFGARGSHRLEENDGKSSERQTQAEQRNSKKFFDKWKGMPIFDIYGMIKDVTSG